MYLLGNKCLLIIPRLPILTALLTDSDALDVVVPTESRNSAFYRSKTTIPLEANSLESIWRVFRVDTWMRVSNETVVTLTSVFRTKLDVLERIHNKFVTDILSSRFAYEECIARIRTIQIPKVRKISNTLTYRAIERCTLHSLPCSKRFLDQIHETGNDSLRDAKT
jgi:uncharacterized protein (UPF0216 family)